jgi:hypothetical protein
MMIKNKTALVKGLLLGLSFMLVLVTMFSPVFGGGKNGLEYADDMFNKLSKGSSYFIPNVRKTAEKFSGKDIAISVKLGKPEESAVAVKLLERAGAQVKEDKNTLLIAGDFGKMLANVLDDADAGFRNNDAAFSAQYGLSAQTVLSIWWNIMKGMDKAFAKEKKFEESTVVIAVMKKALEPAYNFYGIESQKVADRAGIMSSLLVFYVVYTVWWGFAIYFLFEAIGLVMRKARKKEEI